MTNFNKLIKEMHDHNHHNSVTDCYIAACEIIGSEADATKAELESILKKHMEIGYLTPEIESRRNTALLSLKLLAKLELDSEDLEVFEKALY